jgi:preprotein translocase subunit SecG
MTGFPIVAISFVLNLMAFLFVVCSVLLILIVLIQKGKGGGLSSAFGGGMASGLLGSKTGDFLTWVTIVFVGVMLTLAVVLAKYYKPLPTTIPGASTSTTAPPQETPATTPSQETAPAATGQESNDNNSVTLPSGASSTAVPAIPAPAESTTSAGESTSTNQSSDVNQIGN